MVSKPPSSSLASTSASSSRRPAASTNSSVRRNLFHDRDIGARFHSRSTSASTATLQKSLQESLQDDVSEVVVKDCNGKYEVQTPCLPPQEDDQLQDESTEKDKIEIRLLEMYKNRSLQPDEASAELFNAVQSSLKRTVTSLDEDNWIFEPNSWAWETLTIASR
ncbi:hypothetical protein MMC31_005097 [Peltigera leucophlebia]|nr:hypothetical protein [Peltigera leucophlebia]